MPLISTRGAASAQGFGEFAQSAAVNYIEDVFSTYLYTGNGSTQTITNGIDLAGKGGLVWIKNRTAAQVHDLYDTDRGASNALYSNTTNAQVAVTGGGGVSAFNSNGFTVLATSGNGLNTNSNTYPYASWTFRKQAKFFDIVTYTGNGSNPRTISHNLGSAPGFIITKRTDSASNWRCYHVSIGINKAIYLDTTAAVNGEPTFPSAPTSSTFTIGSAANQSGGTYVAYLFAHNAGGFGLSGTDNVISCGSYTGNGSTTGPVVTLGYEPQWLLVKNATSTGDWNLIDNMRGFIVGGADAELNPNLSNAESTGTFVSPTATGFQINTTDAGYNTSSATYIYIAIRRGPMKVPTSGTSVYNGVTFTGDGAASRVIGSVGFPPDAFFQAKRNETHATVVKDRLRGTPPTIATDNTNDEATYSGLYNLNSFDMNGVTLGSATNVNEATKTYINWFFRRAPGFFDVVCYTGNNGAAPFAHNLGVKPELLFIKRRNVVADWEAHFNYGSTNYGFFYLNQASAKQFDVAAPTATTFSPFSLNTNTAVAYLFATVAGVSKVGSYTGSGTTKQIDCGFTAGARFVLIKRTDSTGDWYVYDSARGIVAGNDPYLFLNSTAAEVTSTDYVDTYSAGFELSSTAPAGLNANGGSFIFFAVA